MDLLSAGERQEFRNAMKDVQDTFFKTPVTYHRKIAANMDRFNEKQLLDQYQDYTIPALIEYGIIRENDKLKFEIPGSKDLSTIQITMNIDVLTDLGLWDATTNTALMDGQMDYLSTKGDDYLITQLGYDGPFEDKPIHVVIFADPKPRKTV